MELLNSLLIEAGLLMAIPLTALAQLAFHSLLPACFYADSDAINSRGRTEQRTREAVPARDVTYSIAGVALKRVPSTRRQFRRGSPIVIE